MARPKVMVDLVCAWCGQPFQRQRCNHNKSIRLGSTEFYCSKVCSQAHHAVKNAKPCATCGKPVAAGRKSRNATYCSKACTPSKKTLAPKTCPACSVVFQPKSSRTVYCGATCANTAHSTRMLGMGNSNYKDGSSYSLWFSLARKLVLERDARCVACGATQNLHCHHIDHDPKNNRVENLVMLCGTCHIGHHKSATTRLPWLRTYAQAVSRSMTFRWKKQAASLLTRFSSATA